MQAIEELREKAHVVIETQIRSRNGEIYDLFVSLKLIELDGEPCILGTLADVTKRKKAERALREGEERLRFALESCHIGSWDVDLADYTACRSREHARIFGYEQVQSDWSIEMFLEHVLPEYRVPVKNKIQNAIETQSDFSFECRIRRVDGQFCWIWVAGRYGVDVGDNTRHLIGIVQDITERKAHEVEIERLSRLYATMSQINQTIIHVNSHEELTHEVARVAVEFGGFKIAWVGRFNSQTRQVVPLGWAGELWEVIHNFRHSLADTTENKCLCVPVILENRSIVLNDLAVTSPEMSEWLKVVGQAGIRAAAVFPIRVRGAVWGVFGVYESEANVFRDKEIGLLEETAMDIGYAIEHIDSEAQRRQAEKFQILSIKILGILNEPLTLREASNTILGLIKKETGLDAVGIRLKDGDDFPYFSEEGFDKEFLLAENSVILRSETGLACRDANGQLCLECSCGMVLAEKCGPASDHVTPAGSIWTNDSLSSAESLSGHDPRLNPRNRCVHEGFLSVALIPIRAGTEMIGLLHLNDRRKDRFTPDSIRFFEGLTASFGIAVKRKRAEDALQESKERFRALFEQAAVGVAEIESGTGRFLRVNQRYCDIVGYNQDEMLSLDFQTITHPDDLPEDLAYMEQLKAGAISEFAMEKRYRRKDGTLVWVALTVSPLWPRGAAPTRHVAVVQDITARKRAEEAIHNERILLQSVMNGAGKAHLVYLDRDFNFVLVNETYASTCGYRPEEMVGKNHFMLYPHAENEAIFCRVRDTGKPVEIYDKPFEFPDHPERGTTYWDWTLTPVLDADRQVTGLIFSLFEVTEHKRAEDDLRFAMNFLDSVIDSSPFAMWVADRHGIITRVNRSLCEAINLKKEQIVGKYSVLQDANLELQGVMPQVRAVFDKCMPARFDIPWEASRSGSVDFTGAHDMHIDVSMFPILDVHGKLTSVVCQWVDITQRKKAEESLRESEARFRSLIEGAPEAIFVQCAGTFQFVNQAMLKLVGATQAEDLLGRPFLDCIASEFHEVIRERIRRQQDSGDVAPLMEQQYLRLDGTRVPVETTAVITRFKGQDGHLVFVRDITMRKEEEKERVNLEAKLQQAQKMESVGRLAGGVAHDFNNMLGIILGHTDLILEQVEPANPFHESLTEIRKAGERSADLTRQLLAFARKQTVAPKVIDLNNTLAGMAKMLKRLIGEDIDVEWIPCDKIWPVKIDPSQINQMLANLCINARDAIAGVGKVTIETGNSVFDEAYCMEHTGMMPGEYVMLAVSDNGCGMDSETLSHLFEPFFTTKELGKGTGLGLATVYGVVKQNNGLINVYSEPGQGTTFRIYLPRYLDKTVSQPDKKVEKPDKRGHETILLVEDEPAILKITMRMLELQGYTVVAAGTPGEAIRLANQHSGDIHLLLSDVVMPEMNGRDLAKNILSLYPNLKCLFMSGYTRNVIAHRGVIDEGVNFIEKPFSKAELTVKVREALDKD